MQNLVYRLPWSSCMYLWQRVCALIMSVCLSYCRIAANVLYRAWITKKTMPGMAPMRRAGPSCAPPRKCLIYSPKWRMLVHSMKHLMSWIPDPVLSASQPHGSETNFLSAFAKPSHFLRLNAILRLTFSSQLTPPPSDPPSNAPWFFNRLRHYISSVLTYLLCSYCF